MTPLTSRRVISRNKPESFESLLIQPRTLDLIARGICLVLLLGACRGTPVPTKSDETGSRALRVGLVGVGPLDPAAAVGESTFAVIRTACDTLLELDPVTAEAKPALADSFTLAPGALKLTLHLRPKVKFHDRSPVDAPSVVESLNRIARPSTGSRWAGLLSNVTGFPEVRSGAGQQLSGIKVINLTTIEIDLSQPDADLPVLLSHPALTPVSPQPGSSGPIPACAGPYLVSAGAQEGELRLDVDAQGRSQSSAYEGQGRGLTRTIVIRSFASVDEAYDLFKSGGLDVAPVPQARISEASRMQGYARQSVPEVTYIAFDVSKPQTASAAFRQAVSAAISRLVIIDAAFGDDRRPAANWLEDLDGFISTSTCDPFAGKVADADRAKSLMKDSGLDPSTVKLPLIFDQVQISRLVVQALQVELQQGLGITIDPQPLDAAGFQASISSRTGAALWILTNSIDLPTPDEVFGTIFHTAGSENQIGFSDLKVDGLIDQANRSSEEQERRQLWTAAENAVCDEMPLIPLWFGVRHWVTNPRGIEFKGTSKIDRFGQPILRNARTL